MVCSFVHGVTGDEEDRRTVLRDESQSCALCCGQGVIYRAHELTHLAGKQGRDAAIEFQNILDRPGLAVNEAIGALARLGMARAHALAGDKTKARSEYQDFLNIWKDADPDIPILKQAQAEYAKLQ